MLRLRIAKLKTQAFGKSAEQIERGTEQPEPAAEKRLIASAESVTAPADDDAANAVPEVTTGADDRGRPRRSDQRQPGKQNARHPDRRTRIDGGRRRAKPGHRTGP